MNPTILGVIGPGFLNQVPTLLQPGDLKQESNQRPTRHFAILMPLLESRSPGKPLKHEALELCGQFSTLGAPKNMNPKPLKWELPKIGDPNIVP